MPDQNVFDTATRIAAGDNGKNYDKVAITLHWLTAFFWRRPDKGETIFAVP